MSEEFSTEKWLSLLSEDGVEFKVWDSTIDLEHEREDERLFPVKSRQRSEEEFLAVSDTFSTDSYTQQVQVAPNPVETREFPGQQVKKAKPIIAEKYQVVSELGKGVMCNVYKVRDLTSGEIKVLKLLPQDAWSDQRAQQRFYNDAQVIANLSHSNLIPFKEYGMTADRQPYLAMDYLHGITLARAIKANGGLPLPRVVQIFDQLCHGLSEAHSRGMVHRDIRPENIMFLSQGDFNLKLVDFGLAKLVLEGIDPIERLNSNGDVFGSPPFMSPEEALGEPLDARSDIYSIGCVIYCAMTGEPPFKGSSSKETLKKQVTDELTHPSKVMPDMCSGERAGWVMVGDLEQIVFKCTEKDPAQRYQSVDEVLGDLDKLRQQIPFKRSSLKTTASHKLRTTEVAVPQRSKGKDTFEMLGALLYITIFLFIVCAAAVFFFMSPKPPVEPEETQLPPQQTPPPHLSPQLQLPPPPVNSTAPKDMPVQYPPTMVQDSGTTPSK